MKKRPLCINCAFTMNLENNPGVMVMSTNSDKFETRCHNCNKKIGHSKELNKLIGIYHQARHEANAEMYKLIERGVKFSLLNLFNGLQRNELNGDTLNCFIEAVRGKKYSERYIERWFRELVDKQDYEPHFQYKFNKEKGKFEKHLHSVKLYDKNRLLEELFYISSRK